MIHDLLIANTSEYVVKMEEGNIQLSNIIIMNIGFYWFYRNMVALRNETYKCVYAITWE